MPGKRRNRHHNDILHGISKGPWAEHWAQAQEERGRSFSGQNVYDLCPEPPRWARAWARKLADDIVEANDGLGLEPLFLAARDAGLDMSRENFGFCLGCEAYLLIQRLVR